MTEELSRPLADFPAPRACPFQPPAEHELLRREHRVFRVHLPSDQTALLVTRHADARKALEDPRLSADMSRANFPMLRARPVDSPIKGTFMRADGAQHLRVRRMLNREFTVRRAESLRPLAEQVVDERLDAMLAYGPGVDLVEQFALPIPSAVICRMMGVPVTDNEIFQRNARRMVNTLNDPQDVQAAAGELYAYLGALTKEKMADPGDDLISRLLAGQVEVGDMEMPEFLSIVMILLIGGHETTGSMIASGVLTLLRNPGQLAALRADPSLIDNTVEELLRYLTVAQVGTFRVALADIEIGDTLVRAGEGVIFDLTSANHDDEVFAEPDSLNVARGNSRRHIAFSHGPHNCVGQSLARVELTAALARLFDRFPDLALAVPEAELTYRPYTVGLAGVERLPVRW
ncbi:MAG TPA: cytochrome P450 [Pseudonocardiaceae bacterium]|jgi:cytochrome P450